MPVERWLEDEAATDALAAAIAAAALRPGLSLCLQGPLGAGKSVLARGIIRSALAEPAAEIPSPTFTLVQIYETEAGEIWHFDLYRLGEPEEAIELGFEEAAARAIPLIEWPERLGPLRPDERLEIGLAVPPGAPHARRVRITAHGRLAQSVLKRVTDSL